MTTQIGLSDLEVIVYNWLTKHQIMFSFQSSFSGGRFELGGSVVDFTLDDMLIAIRVQGEYFHKGVEKTGTDAVQREILESQGWTVVDVWGEDILDPSRLEETMQKAIRGEEVL